MIADLKAAGIATPLSSSLAWEEQTPASGLPGRSMNWLLHPATLLAVLGLNFFVRCRLDQAGTHVNSFLETCWRESLPEVYALSWWQYFLPIKALTGSWCTTSLLLVHGLERLLDNPVTVFYLTNAAMIATAYVLSWHVFRSWIFTLTLSLCFALSTFNHHTYVISGTVAMPLIISYLLFFLFCQFKLMQAHCNYKVWVPLGLVSMIVYALSYEGWLDCVAYLGVAYPFLIVLVWRAGDSRRAQVAGAILIAVTLAAGVYVLTKTKLGDGQGGGSESDVVFNYGLARALVGLEDVIAHWFTLVFITISTYVPPFLFNASLSSWRYGTDHIIQLQNGYHEQQAHLVGYSHLFLWRFYAGVAAAAFLFWFCKSVRAAWRLPNVTSVAFFLFLLMTLMSGATHMLVKYRPMHSAPFLGYHSYFGIVGFSLLLSLCAWRVHANFQRRWLAWTIIVLIWTNLGYCALARPSLLSHMAVQCGFGSYPDAWKNLKSMLRS
jgi:hypothetical protein